METGARPGRALLIIKLLHTVFWALFASCILALPVAAWIRRFDWAGTLTAVTLVECIVLAANRCRCPLSYLASRYTADRSPNFDIFLPNWLAQHNKRIFGALFIAGILILLLQWLH